MLQMDERRICLIDRRQGRQAAQSSRSVSTDGLGAIMELKPQPLICIMTKCLLMLQRQHAGYRRVLYLF
jgi:hypothetical protein